MNWYCFKCGAVWCALSYLPETCSDCGSNEIACQSTLTERFVRERLLPLPNALAVQIGESDRALVKWLCERLSGNLDYQDMILNGPLAQDDGSREEHGG